MAQEPLQLRPMTTADIIDTAIRLYRHNFGLFLGIAAVVQLPTLVAQVASSAVISAAVATEEEVNVLAMGGVTVGIVVLALAAVLLYPLGQAAMTVAVSERYLGHSTSVRAAYAAAVPHYWRVLWTSVLAWLAIYGGFFLCVIPGIWLGIRLLLAPSVTVVLEGRWGSAGLSRSWRLTEGNFWSIFGTMAVLVLMVMVATYGVITPVAILMGAGLASDPSSMTTYQVVTQSLAATMQMVLAPLWMLGIVLVYYDLRIRKEGFDLLMMAQALGVPAPTYAMPQTAEPLYPAAPTSAPDLPAAKPAPWPGQSPAGPPAGPSPQAPPLYPPGNGTVPPPGPPAAPPPTPPAAPPPLYPPPTPPKPPGDTQDA